MNQTPARRSQRTRFHWLIAVVAACAGFASAACSTDSATTEEPTVVDSPDPAPGAADGVVDGSEGGMDLDDGNVPGTPNDADVDEAEDN